MVNVYLISNFINGEKLYKIGFTKRAIEKRLKDFKTGNVSKFYLVDSFCSIYGTKIEAYLHNHFKHKNIQGEWFELDDNDVIKFKEICVQIHNTYEMMKVNNTYYQDKHFK